MLQCLSHGKPQTAGCARRAQALCDCGIFAQARGGPQRPPMAVLGVELGLSSSEVHAAIRRGRASGLLQDVFPQSTSGKPNKAPPGCAPGAEDPSENGSPGTHQRYGCRRVPRAWSQVRLPATPRRDDSRNRHVVCRRAAERIHRQRRRADSGLAVCRGKRARNRARAALSVPFHLRRCAIRRCTNCSPSPTRFAKDARANEKSRRNSSGCD